MISIDRVYKTIQSLANSDVRGNVKPDELRLSIHSVVNEIYEEYFAENNRIIARETRGLNATGIDDMVARFGQKITYFLEEELVSKVGGLFHLSKKVRYLDAVFNASETLDSSNISSVYEEFDEESNELEVSRDRRHFELLKRTVADIDFPVCYYRSNFLEVYPKEISKLRVSYLRQPKVANWTFIVIDGVEVFNPSAPDFMDIDLHPSEEFNVILRTLEKFGIVLKENDLKQYFMSKDYAKFNKENAN